jgi:predicted acylesterase/phospholipase RssA
MISKPPSPFTYTPTPDPHADVGIAFPQGAMHGVYQAGVVHAFVLSEYFPGVIGGTSAGAVNGTALALAGQKEGKDRGHVRLAIAEANVELWLRNPAQRLLDSLVSGPLGVLARDLAAFDLTLGELVEAVRREPAGLARLLLRLPRAELRTQHAALRALLGAAGGVVHALGGGRAALRDLEREALLHAVQHVLAAYGMDRALSHMDPVLDHFDELVARHAPGGLGCTLGALDRVELVFQTADLDRPNGDGDSAVLDLARGPCGDRRDFSGANLVAALRASCAFAPFYAGIHARDLGMSTLPDGVDEGDVLLDAAIVAKDPLSPVIGRWAHRGETDARRHRLFTVHNEPLDAVPAPADKRSFLRQAVHTLTMLDGLDQRYAARVIDENTRLLDAIGTKAPLPPRDGGGSWVRVDTATVSPRRTLPFAALSVPSLREMQAACAAGCRAGLKALHGETLGKLPKAPSKDPEVSTVDCAALLTRLRQDHPGVAFQPSTEVCAHCTQRLTVVRAPEVTLSPEQRADLNDFPPFHERERRGEKRLTVAVPAGGVFLGVFQFGAIAALRAYGIAPDLYAGASVGTIFSYLLDRGVTSDELLPEIVKLSVEIPTWVDGGPHKSRLDATKARLEERWESAAVEPLRAMRPREIAAMLATHPQGAGLATWDRFRAGAGALFTLPPGATPWPEVHRALQSLVRLRLSGAVELLDDVTAGLGLYDRAHPERGEIIGFQSIAAKLLGLVFDGKRPTLDAYARDRRVRFVFTVTNQTLGRPETFGMADEHTTTLRSPDAIEATLAASSFPLAFRRRTRAEIFGQVEGEEIDRADQLYSDGGIFNNFPSDAAFDYLQALTLRPETRWIGAEKHRMLLLSLTSPTTFERGVPEEDALVWNLLRAGGRSDDEKVRKTLRSQLYLTRLAGVANQFLKGDEPQAIMTEPILITPAYGIYPHPFAFKEYLGFAEDKQLEMLASGCRRARIALEWPKFRGEEGDPKTRLPLFRDALDEERKRIGGLFHEAWELATGRRTCFFGHMTHLGQDTDCPFWASQDTLSRQVYERCRATVEHEFSLADRKL